MELVDDYSALLQTFNTLSKEFSGIRRQTIASREINIDETHIEQRNILHDRVVELQNNIALKHQEVIQIINKNTEFEKQLKTFLLKATEQNHVDNIRKINAKLNELLNETTLLIQKERQYGVIKANTDKLLKFINIDIGQDKVQQRIQSEKVKRKTFSKVIRMEPQKTVLYPHEKIPLHFLEQYLPDMPHVTLREHQLRVIQHVLTHRGTLAIHSMGSGKTLVAVTAAKAVIQAMKQQNKKIKLVFLSPKSLTANFKEQMIKAYANNDFTDYHFYGYDAFYRDYKKGEIDCTNTFLIIDEAHNLRTKVELDKNKGKRAKKIIGCAKKAFKVLLLSGTPVINDPYDIVNLIAMIDGTDPMSDEKFDLLMHKKNQELFNRTFSCKLSFYQHPHDAEAFPSTEVHRLEMPMNEHYYQKYYEIQMRMSNFFGTEKNLAVFYNGLRKATTSHMSDDEIIDNNPKLVWLREHLSRNIRRRTVIFAQFIEFGVEQIARICKQLGIKYEQITGQTEKTERTRIVNDYNRGNLSLVIISKAGGEGLNLIETSDFILMAPGWNAAERDQAIARSVRFMSHARLSPSKRHVDIYKLILKKPDVLKEDDPRADSIDEILDELSEKKTIKNEAFLDRLRPLSIENDKNCERGIIGVPIKVNTQVGDRESDGEDGGEEDEIDDVELDQQLSGFNPLDQYDIDDEEDDIEEIPASKKRERGHESEDIVDSTKQKKTKEVEEIEDEEEEDVELDEDLLKQIFEEDANEYSEDQELSLSQSL